ncbi:MAG: aminopeptidase P family protein [Thermomicrobiaceae bacterium]|nr:aminopeptidase P family protein [Thermomicrobiaceae bacterium]
MQSRIATLRERLAASHLDAIVITHPSNRYYLTGYSEEDIAPNESAGHLVVGLERAVLVVGALNAEAARQQAPGVEIFASREFARADAEIVQEMGARRVGFEDGAILYADYRTLSEALGDGVELTPVGRLVDELRAVKTPEEIALLEEAIAITDRAFEEVAATIREGDTEREIALRLDEAMRRLGAEGPSFETIVAAGPNAAMPHHHPSDRAVRAGEPVVIDMGARYRGYCADLTRTVWVGEPDETLRAIYPVVLRALDAVEERIRPGMTGKEVDAIAREVIAAAGYGEEFNHSLGHGVGVRVHEGPSLSPRSDEPLRAGHVVTLEPGIYLPGKGGVRIEDVAIVEEHDVRIVTRAPKQLIDE